MHDALDDALSDALAIGARAAEASEQLRALVVSMLAIEPRERPQSYEALVPMLRACPDELLPTVEVSASVGASRRSRCRAPRRRSRSDVAHATKPLREKAAREEPVDREVEDALGASRTPCSRGSRAARRLTGAERPSRAACGRSGE